MLSSLFIYFLTYLPFLEYTHFGDHMRLPNLALVFVLILCCILLRMHFSFVVFDLVFSTEPIDWPGR